MHHIAHLSSKSQAIYKLEQNYQNILWFIMEIEEKSQNMEIYRQIADNEQKVIRKPHLKFWTRWIKYQLLYKY